MASAARRSLIFKVVSWMAEVMAKLRGYVTVVARHERRASAAWRLFLCERVSRIFSSVICEGVSIGEILSRLFECFGEGFWFCWLHFLVVVFKAE